MEGVTHQVRMHYPKLLGLMVSRVSSASFLHAHDYDVVVYGGTSGGVIAAVQAKAMGKTVVLVGPDKHLGGLSSGGLGYTDTGNKSVIGGLSREFYHRRSEERRVRKAHKKAREEGERQKERT